MDWIWLVALAYLVVTTPLALVGLVSVYMLVSAFFLAQEDRKSQDRDG
jgi:hypothetical protein